MKPAICILTCLPFILGSCSGYQKVSLANFQENNISVEERENLHFVLKDHELHYSYSVGRITNTYYEADRNAIYKSLSGLIEENIVIPKGAPGKCVHATNDNFIIDFGDGVLVSFDVYQSFCRAKSELEVEERRYYIEAGDRIATLYFSTR